MSSTVEVVLKESLEHLGSIGDVVRVRRGYARNYLLPRGLAVVASRGNVRQIEHEKAVQAQRVAKLRADQEAIVSELAEITIMVAKEAGEDGKLFGSVTSNEVIEGLKAKDLKIEIDKKKLVMPDQPIKEVGSYEVGVKLPYGLTATFQLEVKTRA
ncbi:MAG: 50S ribosomal protein L9 [Myxococcales bacterium]|nr:50S ribosomal protein L9 [Myxococcales bacterium]MDH3482718.1 50S ribosomal protein L9 [Myxococcales bacterium]